MNVTSILVRSVLTLLFVAVSPIVVRAQSVVDPTRAEFAPSADHSATLPDGSPTVDHYELEFYLIGAAAPFQVAAFGKPAPEPDGMIRVNFASVLTSYPAPGIVYDAAVAAMGPSGVGRSTLSNTFSFSPPTPCSFTVSPTSQTIVAGGGTASATVTTTSGCSWTATSTVTWITVTAGSSGSGTGTVTYTAAANTATTSRSGTVTVAGQTVTVTQSAATPSNFFQYAGGPVRAKRARTQTAPSNLAGGAAYVNLLGATLSYTVPAGTSDLFNVAFSAECTKFGGGTAHIRVLVDGVPMEPSDGFQTFCTSAVPATHKGNWVGRVEAGAHTLQVQFRNTAGGVTVDDWTFELVVYD